MHVEVPRQPIKAVTEPVAAQSLGLRESVVAARTRQLARAGTLNARLTAKQLRETTHCSTEATNLLERCARRWNLSGRAVTRTLKTARTIADIEPARAVEQRHVAEALQMRQLDKRLRNDTSG
jgi:magnesium chelatase family protein